MKRFKIFSVSAILFSLLSVPAYALVELKLGYGTHLAKPSLGAIYGGTDSDIPGATPVVGLTTDFVVTLPIVGLGAGIRYEDMKISYSSSALDAELAYKRTAAIINYRLIDTLLYLGPIFTYGLSHSGAKASLDGMADLRATPDSVTSSSLGLEVGAKLIGMQVGAEIGTMDMRWNDTTNSVNNSTADLNMSGSYMKIFVGLGI